LAPSAALPPGFIRYGATSTFAHVLPTTIHANNRTAFANSWAMVLEESTI
jgi:hypothetical protein